MRFFQISMEHKQFNCNAKETVIFLFVHRKRANEPKVFEMLSMYFRILIQYINILHREYVVDNSSVIFCVSCLFRGVVAWHNLSDCFDAVPLLIGCRSNQQNQMQRSLRFVTHFSAHIITRFRMIESLKTWTERNGANSVRHTERNEEKSICMNWPNRTKGKWM